MSVRKIPVRAKFRCLSISSGWDGGQVARLAPVQAKETDYVEGARVERHNPENSRFWSATPSGEASVGFGFRRESRQEGNSWKQVQIPYAIEPFEAGAYYYIDFFPPEDRKIFEFAHPHLEPWRLDCITLLTGPSAKFSFTRQGGAGSIEMTIENRGAIQHFLGPWMAKFQEKLAPDDSDVMSGYRNFSDEWLVAFSMCEPPEAVPAG